MQNEGLMGENITRPKEFPKFVLPMKNRTPTKPGLLEVGKYPFNVESGIKTLAFKPRANPIQQKNPSTTPPHNSNK